MDRSTEHQVDLLLAVIPALLDAAERIASGRRESVTVTVDGSPRRFRTPLDALEVAEQMTAELGRALGEEAAQGASYAAVLDAVALLIERRPFRLADCEALKGELVRVRELVMQARAKRGNPAKVDRFLTQSTEIHRRPTEN